MVKTNVYAHASGDLDYDEGIFQTPFKYSQISPYHGQRQQNADLQP